MASNDELFHPPGTPPDTHFKEEELVFTADEKALIKKYQSEYPNAEGPVMKVLWLAQNKFGYLPPEVISLVARELKLPASHVFGVASFYTQYYKSKTGKYVLDVCTCFSCQYCGGYDVLHYLEEKLAIRKGETTEDSMFSIREVECLGACGSAPMLQVTNGPYVHNLTPAKIDSLVENLRQGRMPAFVSVSLPQDEDEMGRNRRTDTDAEPYRTPPVSETVS